MIRPSPYADPCQIIAHREFITVGCGGCQYHQPNHDRSEYRCELEMPGYPDQTNRTCRRHRRRERA